MRAEKNKAVSIDYTLTDAAGKVIDTSRGEGGRPLTYLHGAGNIVPGLERALEGKSAGESIQVSVPPDEGYGQKDPRQVQAVPRRAFGGVADIKPGMQFRAQGPGGQSQVVTVTKVDADTVTVDANHPLAGETLNFDVTVVDVRDATQEEIDHGHAHGAGGHHH